MTNHKYAFNELNCNVILFYLLYNVMYNAIYIYIKSYTLSTHSVSAMWPNILF